MKIGYELGAKNVVEIWSGWNLQFKKFEGEEIWIWSWINLKLKKFEVVEIGNWRKLKWK